MKIPFVFGWLGALALTCVTSGAQGAASSSSARDAAELATFEQEVIAAKERGVTRFSVTAGLPPSAWQFDLVPGDPYPAWFVGQAGLLKIFPPKEVQPFIPADYVARVSRLVEERCKILRKHGLKGHWNANEPQTLPEAFFTAFPKLRGARVDQPNRARAAWFAPCVDQPDTLRLYREALRAMWARCPEIDSFSFLTSDSGSGFCWVPGLYPGINGHSDCKERPMATRVAGFMKNFQEAANEFGLTVTMNINPIAPRQWMTDSFSPETLASIVRELPRGMAVDGQEGPDGRAFGGGRGFGSMGGGRSAFYPVVGLPLEGAGGGGGGGRGGAVNQVERVTAQRRAAVAEVGEALADELMNFRSAFAAAQTRLDALNFGAMLRFGHVLGRWINRPMVPFPAELKPEERDYFQKYLFQARSEDQAHDLADIQGMLMYKGWGAKMLFQRVIETTVPEVRSALRSAQQIAEKATDEGLRRQWSVHVLRVEAVLCLLQSADHMVAYQAHLDRVRELGVKPEYNPPLGVQSDWARSDMIELARREIDNTVRLLELIRATPEPVIDMAPTPEDEYIMRLGPDLPAQLSRKIDTMNSRWMDYARIFSVPNP